MDFDTVPFLEQISFAAFCEAALIPDLGSV